MQKFYHIPGERVKMTRAYRNQLNERFNWKDLGCFKDNPSFFDTKIVQQIRERGTDYTPHERLWLRPLELTPFNRVKAVFLVPNPYRDPKYNDGLAISHPPHLKERHMAHSVLMTEYERDLGYGQARNPSLVPWARQGVLLLNMRMTCDADRELEPHEAYHYRAIQWKGLIREILCQLSDKRQHVAFVLFGRATSQWARKVIFDQDRHLIIDLPWDVYGNLDGSQLKDTKIFSRINNFLRDNKVTQINWRLPSYGRTKERRRKIFRTTTSEKGKAWKAFQKYKAERLRGKVVI